MSHLVKFYGASDDLVEVEGDIKGCDEYPGEHGAFEVAGLRIDVGLTKNGNWSITANVIDEDVPVTAHDIYLFPKQENDYSVTLEMAVPDGSYISKVGD